MWLQLRKVDDASVCNDAGDDTVARLELAAKDSVGEAVQEGVHSSVSGNPNGLADQRGTRRWSPHIYNNTYNLLEMILKPKLFRLHFRRQSSVLQ